MPSTRQGGGYTLTFAKRNKDIQNLLANKKNQGIVITDYICEAIRFFEENKANTKDINNINFKDNIDLIEKIVEEKIQQALNKAPNDKFELNNKVEINTNTNDSLESNLEGITIDDD